MRKTMKYNRHDITYLRRDSIHVPPKYKPWTLPLYQPFRQKLWSVGIFIISRVRFWQKSTYRWSLTQWRENEFSSLPVPKHLVRFWLILPNVSKCDFPSHSSISNANTQRWAAPPADELVTLCSVRILYNDAKNYYHDPQTVKEMGHLLPHFRIKHPITSCFIITECTLLSSNEEAHFTVGDWFTVYSGVVQINTGAHPTTLSRHITFRGDIAAGAWNWPP
jgi:hypothetical protein